MTIVALRLTEGTSPPPRTGSGAMDHRALLRTVQPVEGPADTLPEGRDPVAELALGLGAGVGPVLEERRHPPGRDPGIDTEPLGLELLQASRTTSRPPSAGRSGCASSPSVRPRAEGGRTARSSRLRGCIAPPPAPSPSRGGDPRRGRPRTRSSRRSRPGRGRRGTSRGRSRRSSGRPSSPRSASPGRRPVSGGRPRSGRPGRPDPGPPSRRRTWSPRIP